jgi:16S rRNA processing protein RimM
MPLWKLENSVRIGEVLKAFSYQGYVRVAFFLDGLEETLVTDSFVFIEWSEKPIPYRIEDISWMDEKIAKLKLKFVNNEDEADELRGKFIHLEKERIPIEPKGKSKKIDLIDYKVHISNGDIIGEVERLDEEGLQQLLVVKSGNKEILIPYHQDIIKRINHRAKTIIVDLPEGLLEL